jgi:hypothetical protein
MRILVIFGLTSDAGITYLFTDNNIHIATNTVC